ncbi:MAG: Na(+)/H(+) antiporter subunit D [Rhodospirillaceae bacterium]|nr:Na(+)/H(+) antiporter subunit D [Rhodospirillaceae bacterium]|tara:strand:+ start:9487 stop:11175 length:1689 start_codon:yes stop_codon:yes gene_type:complete
MIEFPPGLLLIVGAILVPLLPHVVRNAYMLALPVIGFWGLLVLPEGIHFGFDLFGYTLAPVRVDGLSLIFGYIFHIAAAISIIFAFHMKDSVQQMAGLIYAGSAIGGAFAGDLITLFVYWEGTAIASVFLIWANKSEHAYKTGMRYLIIQVGSGVLLLAGAILQFKASGSLDFAKMELSGPGPVLIFIAFGIKAAFPLLHNWLQDSYPEATVTGTVFLSAFTTKLAIYALARGFPGTEMLIWIGATMAAFPIFYALIENDLRRVLAYSLNNQLGYMVVAVGVGTEMALNGAAAHAVSHVLYKALLFMSMGAVLYRTGTAKASELGGLYKSMPYTTGFCMVGAASISAFPLFSGFISKSIIIAAVAEQGHWVAWIVLLFAAAGVLLYSGIKVPYFAFFNQDSGQRPQEAPLNMLIAMGITAFLCIAIGIYPAPLLAALPFPEDFQAYTTSHVITHLQLLLFSALVFTYLVKKGYYPPQLKAINLDFDWTYRRLIPNVIRSLGNVFVPADRQIRSAFLNRVEKFIAGVFRHHGPEGLLARTWPTGSTVLWVAVLLSLYMLFYFI